MLLTMSAPDLQIDEDAAALLRLCKLFWLRWRITEAPRLSGYSSSPEEADLKSSPSVKIRLHLSAAEQNITVNWDLQAAE